MILLLFQVSCVLYMLRNLKKILISQAVKIPRIDVQIDERQPVYN